MSEWWESHENLIALARWLEWDGQFDGPLAVIEFFESPWSWGAEWEHYKAGQLT